MTYSIVARDPSTGQLGVAVQSRWFSVGSIVSWAEPGVGAVATQSFAEVTYGPHGLDLMRDGASATDALADLVRRDEHPEGRQVAMVDASGQVAVHTGPSCVEAAGHVVGDGVSCQANMMENDTVWDAMLEAYRATEGALPDRLMAALHAAEHEGGDMRGQQSAALLVVGGERGDRPWERQIDLRVEDHTDPVGELDRLLLMHRAFDHMNKGDDHAMVGELAKAAEEYEQAAQLLPDEDQVMFWRALTLMGAGRIDEAKELARRARDRHPAWPRFLRRVAASGLVPDDPGLPDALMPLDG